MPDNTLPALSTSRPFIAPRMSAGMKAAVAFLAVTGILVLGGMALTLSQIMQRLGSADQDNSAVTETFTPAQAPTVVASNMASGKSVKSFPVIGRAATDKMLLPKGAEVDEMVAGSGGIFLLIKIPREGQRIVILDSKTGNIRRDIMLDNGSFGGDPK